MRRGAGGGDRATRLDGDDRRSPDEFVARPIGYVENAFTEPAPHAEMTAAESRIVVERSLTEGLSGLEVGQRLVVVFWFHRSRGYDLLQHPRGDETRPKRGVFALRSPRRPNPIGITRVELVGVEGNVLRVRGLDALDGSPVLDLKPEPART